jgi:hypothetical protein
VYYRGRDKWASGRLILVLRLLRARQLALGPYFLWARLALPCGPVALLLIYYHARLLQRGHVESGFTPCIWVVFAGGMEHASSACSQRVFFLSTLAQFHKVKSGR